MNNLQDLLKNIKELEKTRDNSTPTENQFFNKLLSISLTAKRLMVAFAFIVVLLFIIFFAKKNLNRDANQSPIKTPTNQSVKILANSHKEISVFKESNQNTPEALLKKIYNKALLNIQKGNTEQAVIDLKKLMINYPNNSELTNTLATLLLKQNHIDAAKKILTSQLNLQPNNSNVALLLAHILIQKHNQKEAISLLERTIPSKIQENPQYFALLAGLYLQQKNYMLAEKTYKELIDYDNSQGQWWFGLGLSLEKTNQMVAAQWAYQEAKECENLPKLLVDYINTSSLHSYQS
jgi:predicted Zn-dependent protease